MPRKVTKQVEREVWVDHNGDEHESVQQAVAIDASRLLRRACVWDSSIGEIVATLSYANFREALRAALDMADEAYGTVPGADDENTNQPDGSVDQDESELERLLWGAVANAGRLSSERKPRWAHVADALGVGSTKAHELCRRFDVDPDEERGSPLEDTGAVVDGDAANEVLKLRKENARLSQELVRAISEIQRERRERDFSEKETSPRKPFETSLRRSASTGWSTRWRSPAKWRGRTRT